MRNLRRIGALLLTCFLLLLTACGAQKVQLKRLSNEAFPFEGTVLGSGEKADVMYLAGRKLNLCTVWQPGCPPCETELKYLEDLRGRYDEVRIIPLAVAETPEQAEETLKEWGISLPSVYMSDAFFSFLKDKQGLKRTPTMYFLDSEAYPLHEAITGFDDEDKAQLLEILRTIHD